MHVTRAFTSQRLRWSRWLVLALLGLCLPLQGVLAVTMQMTMAMAGVIPVTVAATGDAAGAALRTADVADDSSAGHCHDMAMEATEPASATAPAQDMPDMRGMSGMSHAAPDGASADQPHDGHSCGICTHCCIGAALPVAPVTVAGSSPVEDLPAAQPASVAQALPRALERPPKTVRA